MIRELFNNIGGLGVYGIVSTLIFFFFFVGVLIWALARRPSHIQYMSRLPLDNNQQPVNGD